MSREEDRAQRLEPTQVATGRVLMAIGSLFVLLAAAASSLLVMYRLKTTGSEHIAPQHFPAPALEVNIDPRATAASGHGPKPYARRPPQARAQETAPAPDPLAAAMDAVAARGAQAYDPPPGAPASAPPQLAADQARS